MSGVDTAILLVVALTLAALVVGVFCGGSDNGNRLML